MLQRKEITKKVLDQLPEVVVPRCSVKKVFLEISQNSQENVRVCFLTKLQAFKKENLEQVFLWILRNF